MSSVEKSYFKKFGYKYTKENKAEITLFDVIERVLQKQANIDETFETQVEKSFAAKHAAQLFSKTKTSLYHDILGSLRLFDKNKLNDEKAFENYQFANLLVKKNLFKEALFFIRKAEKICEENEFFELKLLTAQLHAFALSRIVSAQKSEEAIQHLGESLINSETVQNIVALQKNFFQLAFLQKKVGVANQPEVQRELAQLEAALQEATPRSARAALYHLESLSIAANLKGNQRESFTCFQKIIELLDQHPAIRENNLFKYLVVFEQYLQFVLLSFQVNLFDEKFEQFKQINTVYEQEKIWKENSEIFLLCIYALLNRSLGEYDKLEKRFLVLTAKSDFLLPGYRKISIAHYLVMGFFMQNNYEKALDWYQYINNNRDFGVRYDIDSATRIVAMICYYKTRDYSTAEYFLTNTKNFFRSKGKYKAEKLFCQQMSRLIKETDKKDKQASLVLATEEWIQHFAQHPDEAAVVSIFDFVSWIRAEKEDRLFYEVWYLQTFKQ